MEQHGYARNAGAVFSLTYHLVFCSKYRKPVLQGLVAERLQALLALKADELHVTLQTLEVMPDHVHMVVESDPGMAPAKLAAQFKGYTSRMLRQEFRHLRSQLPSLWSRSYYIGSVGQVSEATVRRYIANQKGRGHVKLCPLRPHSGGERH
jgi:putative transposase